MTKLIRYCPQTSLTEIQAFEHRLHTCPGSWTLTRNFTRDDDPSIVRLQWIAPEYHGGDIVGFLAFLDQREHRDLIRTFLRIPSSGLSTDLDLRQKGAPSGLWSCETLLKALQQCLTLQQLQEALMFLEVQELISRYQEHWWQRGLYLQKVHDFGPTLEWLVQEHLIRFHGAFARRRVRFQQWETLGLNDLDVLAFLPDGRTLFVECKSGKIPSKRLAASCFFRRATAFPADIALLLLDIESTEPLDTFRHYLNLDLQRNATHLENQYTYHRSCIYRIENRIFVANTAGGIAATLKGVLHTN